MAFRMDPAAAHSISFVGEDKTRQARVVCLDSTIYNRTVITPFTTKLQRPCPQTHFFDIPRHDHTQHGQSQPEPQWHDKH